MATSQQIALIKYPHQVPQLDIEEGHPATAARTDHIPRATTGTGTDTTPHPLGTTTQNRITKIIETDTDIASQDLTHETIDTGAAVDITHGGDTQDHTADPHITACLNTGTLTHTTIDMTHHTGDLHPAEASPEITVNLDPTQHPNITIQHQPDHPTTPNDQNGKRTAGLTNRSLLMTHHQSTTVLMTRTATQRMI